MNLARNLNRLFRLLTLRPPVKITARRSKLEDAVELSKNLREEDIAELAANTGKAPLTALSQGYVLSTPCYSIVDDTDKVLGMFGAVPVHKSPGVGLVWMLASPGLLKHRRQFLRESKEWIAKLHQKFPILWNYVDARNTTHIRWLKWIGVNFVAEHPEFGVEKRPFKEFIHV